MTVGTLVVLGIVLVFLVIGLFAMLTNPGEIDAEEERSVEKEEKKRWWRR